MGGLPADVSSPRLLGGAGDAGAPTLLALPACLLRSVAYHCICIITAKWIQC